MKAPPFRVLFVCMGNICRSPTAEAVLRQRLERAGLASQVEVDSAGTIDYHTGNPADNRMRAVAADRGYLLTSRARQVSPQDLTETNLMIAMDHANLRGIEQLAAQYGQPAPAVELFCTYCAHHTESEVPDPYYGGADGFTYVMDIIEDGCDQIAATIQARLKASS